MRRSVLNVDQLRKAVGKVVDYCWDAEMADFRSSSDEAKEEHIFQALVTLNAFLVITEELDEDGVSFDLIAGTGFFPGLKRSIQIERFVIPIDELLTHTPDTPSGVYAAVPKDANHWCIRGSGRQRGVNMHRRIPPQVPPYQASTLSTAWRS